MTATNSGSSMQGQVALVTGASRGIGRAIAQELAGRGMKVIGTATSDAGAVAISQSLAAYPGCKGVNLNVNDAAGVDALVEAIVKEHGALHVLVNNAGITRDTLIMTMSEQDWDGVIHTNLKSAFNCSKAAVRHMMRKRYGRIVNITSVAGQMGNAGQTNYSASKAGQIGFTKALAREVASRNITVNAIAAGYIETEIWANVPEEARQAALALIPLNRKGTPEEIAYAAAFLVSDQAAYITGQVLGVDGGMAMM